MRPFVIYIPLSCLRSRTNKWSQVANQNWEGSKMYLPISEINWEDFKTGEVFYNCLSFFILALLDIYI